MEKEITRIMHTIKLRELVVSEVTSLSPSLKRISFYSDDLDDFISLSPEDHIKLFFHTDPSLKVDRPVLKENGLDVAEGVVMRDYTPKKFSQKERKLDIEFVLHGKGPGALWADQAKKGDTLYAAGPRGSMVYPEFDYYLFFGDESSMPALSRRLNELSEKKFLEAYIEVENEEHKVEFESVGDFKINWIYRRGREKGTALAFLEVLQTYQKPKDKDGLMIISLETATTKEIKEYVEKIELFPKKWIKATGYWRK